MSNLTLELVTQFMKEVNDEDDANASLNDKLLKAAKSRFDCLGEVLHTIRKQRNWYFYGRKYSTIPLKLIYTPNNRYGRKQVDVCIRLVQDDTINSKYYWSHPNTNKSFSINQLENDDEFKIMGGLLLKETARKFKDLNLELKNTGHVAKDSD